MLFMEKIYKLYPSCHDNLWGGNKLRAYGKVSDSDRIAESWELSFVPGAEAKTADGLTLTEAFGRSAWGENCRDFEFFPTLTKFIDAREKLSVQVHPSDDYALRNECQYGKTEMWYIVEADEGAGIYMGLSKTVTPEKFAEMVDEGTVEEVLKFHKVKAGDVFFIPAGTVHAICEGVLIFEIQQSSTLTYRLYDYMRRDKDGNFRELHVDKAMLVSELSEYKPTEFASGEVIGSCKYFEVRRLEVDGKRTLTVGNDSFLSISVTCGSGEVEGMPTAAGDSYFSPAGSGEIEISGKLTALAISIPKG